LLVFFYPLGLFAEGDFLSLQSRVKELFNENKDAVVRVKAVYEPEEGEVPQLALGTGFFISRQGYVLTTTSIIYGPKRVWIEYKGISYAVKFVGVDTATNIALLQVINLPEDFDFIHLADYAELPDPGTMVLRLSCPLDFSPSPTFGMVSGVESRVTGHFFPCSYIRTTIPVGMGDGGGAFIDLNGRFLGMQVLALNEVNSSYVVPARALLRVYYDLVSENKVSYGWGGFNVDAVTSPNAGHQFKVKDVSTGSPAEVAGMLKDDVLVKVGDYTINDIDDLRNAFFYTRVGEYIRVKVDRNGEPMEFNMRLAERPASEPPVYITQKEMIEEAVPVDQAPAVEEPQKDMGMDTTIPESVLKSKN